MRTLHLRIPHRSVEPPRDIPRYRMRDVEGENDQPSTTGNKLPWSQVLAFGLPTAAMAFPFMLVQLYFLKFATDVLLLSPAIVALLVGGGRIWDAVSDPAAGYLSDRTRTRLGRRRPWMFVGVPLLSTSFAILWSAPPSLTQTELVIWSGVAMLFIYTAFTVYNVPHQSLGAELSLDHHDRSRIFGTRHIAFQVGMFAAFGCMQLLENTDSPREVAGSLARFSAAICALILFIPPLVLRERKAFQGRGSHSPIAAFRDVSRNRYARILLPVFTIEAMGSGVLGVLAPFYADYVLKSPESVLVVPAAFVVAAVGRFRSGSDSRDASASTRYGGWRWSARRSPSARHSSSARATSCWSAC